MHTTHHPELQTATFRCASCGTSFELRSTAPGETLDVCSNCHPAYTGRERAVATGTRIERFERRLARVR